MASNLDLINKQDKNYKNLFVGDSQMAELMRSYDWASHPLGEPDKWPVSLKTGLRILLHSAHPMFIWWSEEMYMFHNDSYVPLMGNKHPHGLGAKGYEMWGETWPQLGAVLEGILQGEKAFFGQELLVPMNRKGFMEDTYWTFSYSAMFNDEGEVNGIFCACNDVTETVLAKRRLGMIKDLADKLGGLPGLPEMCQGTCELLAGNPQDIPFSLIYLLNENSTEARLLGQSAGIPRAIAPPVEHLSHEGDPVWPFSKVKLSGQAEVISLSERENLVVNKDIRFPEQAVVLPVYQPGKSQLLGFFIAGINPRLEYDSDYHKFFQLLCGQLAGSIVNLNSRARIEGQKARLERLFMQAPAAICILDGPDLVYQLVNPLYQQLFPGRELMGKPILEALPEIIDNKVYRTFRKVYDTGVTHEEQEILIPLARPQDGILEDRYFKYIQQARYDEHGHIDGVLVFAYEVTDLVIARKKVETSERKLREASDELASMNEDLAAANEQIQASNIELNDSNQQLLRINADLDNFIYTASHDLKAPISNIEGLLQALLRSLSPGSPMADRIPQITDMMQGSIDRFKKTIDNLTEISKLQKDTNQQVSLNDFSEVINDVMLDLQPTIQSIKARVEVDTDDCFSVHFSEKNLRSIVYNLLSNALKYHSPDRTPLVQLSCSQTDEYLVLTVKDNGLGMKLSDETQIFSMFKRLHDHVEGAGIGLYMVKKIIDNAGGKIEVESRLGEGSTFRVYFKR